VEMVELHTGRLANAFAEKIEKEELEKLRAAARAASESHLQVNAGHGINYRNIAFIHQIPHLSELNIGHSIVSRAIWLCLEAAPKVFGTGIGKAMGWRNIDVQKKPSGEPFLIFSGPAQELARQRSVTAAFVTLSHTEHHAIACIVLDG